MIINEHPHGPACIGKEGYRLHAGPWSTTQGTTQQEYKTKSFLSFSKSLYWKKMPMSHIPHGQAAFTTSWILFPSGIILRMTVWGYISTRRPYYSFLISQNSHTNSNSVIPQSTGKLQNLPQISWFSPVLGVTSDLPTSDWGNCLRLEMGQFLAQW